MNEQLMAEIRGAVARGYCSENNKNKVMDVDLVESISNEVFNLIELINRPMVICTYKSEAKPETIEALKELTKSAASVFPVEIPSPSFEFVVPFLGYSESQVKEAITALGGNPDQSQLYLEAQERRAKKAEERATELMEIRNAIVEEPKQETWRDRAIKDPIF
jgi:hypothetical protein